MQVIIGRSYHFHYPYYGTPDGYPEYTAHSGKIVTVLRKLGRDEAGDNRMYEVLHPADGWRGHIHGDELFSASERTRRMMKYMLDGGWTIGQRNDHGVKLNMKFVGKYIAVEPHDESEAPTEDGSNGPWCIVGDDVDALLREAYEFARGMAA